MELKSYYPAKPFVLHQAWGIYNPAYLQFGFSKHNGVDFKLGDDKHLYWPVENCTIYDVSYGGGTGWNIRGITNDLYDFSDGVKCQVDIIMMHMDSQAVIPTGTIVGVGAYCGVADNTGFSTGPHTHLLFRRIKDGKVVDTNDANNTIDPMLYMTGFYAQDYKGLVGNYNSLILILQQMVGLLSINKK